MDDCWCVFPWDAYDIYDHTRHSEGSHSDRSGPAMMPAPEDDAKPKVMAATALARR